MCKNVPINYIEYGKIFKETEASDFLILDRSDQKMLDIAGPQRCERFIDLGLKFPASASQSLFCQKIGNLSACFIKPSENYYLFIQIQRREEGEYAKYLKFPPRLNRPYNQIRFTYISKISQKFATNHFTFDLLEELVILGYKVYSSLLYVQQEGNYPQLHKHPNALKNYFYDIQDSGNVIPHYVDFSKIDNKDLSHTITKRLVSLIYQSVNNKPQNFCIQIIVDYLDWKSKIQYLEAAQILLWPIIGIFTFTLDDISERNDIYIHFHSAKVEQTETVKILDIRDEVNTSISVELIELRKRYEKLFLTQEFIQRFRNYYKAGISILESAYLSKWHLSKNKTRKNDAIFPIFNKYIDRFNETGYLLGFIEELNLTLIDLCEIYFEHSFEFTKKSAEVIIDKIIEHKDLNSSYISKLIKDDLFFNLVLSEPIYLQRLLNLIDYEDILAISDKNISLLLFSKKTDFQINSNSLSTDWVKYFSKALDKNLNLDIEQIEKALSGNILGFQNANTSAKIKMVQYLIRNHQSIFSSIIIKIWIPDNNTYLDTLILDYFSKNQDDFQKTLFKAIADSDERLTLWLLEKPDLWKNQFGLIIDKILKHENLQNELAGKSLQILINNTQPRSDVIIKKKDKLSDIAILIFPLSDFTDYWFSILVKNNFNEQYKYLLKKVSELDKSSQGSEKNPRVASLVFPKNYSSVIENCIVDGYINQQLLIFSLSHLSDINLIDFFHTINDDSIILSTLKELIINREQVFGINLASEIIYLVKQNRWRREFIIQGIDYFRISLMKLIDPPDDLSWSIYVNDFIETPPLNICWSDYIYNLPKPKDSASKYYQFFEIINSLDELNNSISDRIYACALYVNFEDNEIIARDFFDQYLKNNPLDNNLKKIIYKKLNPSPPQKQEKSDQVDISDFNAPTKPISKRKGLFNNKFFLNQMFVDWKILISISIGLMSFIFITSLLNIYFGSLNIQLLLFFTIISIIIIIGIIIYLLFINTRDNPDDPAGF